MENKSTLNKKLKSYSALAGTLVAAANTTHAQVVYTNITPDTTITSGGSYELDMDNDGTADYVFNLTAGSYSYAGLTIPYALGTIAVGSGNAIDTVSGGLPPAHNLNDPINSSLLWEDVSAASYQLLGAGFGAPFTAYGSGNFLGATDKYIALRFKIAGADHYGWVRVTMNSGATSLTIKDYAYDGTTSTSIPAGAMVTGINELSAALSKNVAIYSADKAVHVNMNQSPLEGVITVTNMLGQEVANANITSSQITIPMENANTGIYFVTVMQANARYTKKVMIN